MNVSMDLFHPDIIRLATLIIVMLATALAFGRAARALGLPAVFGELAGGIVLGPTLFGSFFPSAFAQLFPTSGLGFSGRNVITQAGLLCFLFAAGLETQPSKIQEQARPILWTSFFGMAIPFLFGFGLVYAWPDLWRDTAANIPDLTLALFLGAAVGSPGTELEFAL